MCDVPAVSQPTGAALKGAAGDAWARSKLNA